MNSAPSRSAGISPARCWAIVILLALASVIAYIDRVNLSIALIGSGFKTFFQLTNTDRGVLNSAFFWSYALLQVPAGWAVDRYGSKYPIAIGFAVWSFITVLTAFTTGFAALFAVRLLLGLGEAVIHPASMRWIRYNFSDRRRGLAIGVFMSGSKFGPAVGAVLAALLIDRYGWRAMFVTIGLASMLWLVPWLFLVRNDQGSVGSGAPSVRAGTIPMSKILASPVLWGTVIGTFCYMYFVYFCLTWMPAYFSEARGLSVGSSSLFTTFSFAGMAVVAIIGGAAADALIAHGYPATTVRRAFTIAGFLLASTALIGAFSRSLDVALTVSVLSLSGLGLATANYWALTQTLLPATVVGRVIGIQNFAASASGIVAPILSGWLVDRTGAYRAPMVTVTFFLILGVAVYLFLVKEKYAPEFNTTTPYAPRIDP